MNAEWPELNTGYRLPLGALVPLIAHTANEAVGASIYRFFNEAHSSKRLK
jgi:hypothetical protein